ncbi:MAG: hypothetical protein ACLSG8_06490 [Barnesiella sp.]
MGIFNFYNEEGDWVPCERDLSQPLRFSVEFYRNKDGYPGDLVYKEEIALWQTHRCNYGDMTSTTSLKEVVKWKTDSSLFPCFRQSPPTAGSHYGQQLGTGYGFWK